MLYHSIPPSDIGLLIWGLDHAETEWFPLWIRQTVFIKSSHKAKGGYQLPGNFIRYFDHNLFKLRIHDISDLSLVLHDFNYKIF